MKYLIFFVSLVFINIVESQTIDLSYYLPDVTYDQNITTPKEFLGFEVGEWHVSHDKLYFYLKTLSEESDRISLTEYARSHEQRPLIYLTITSPSNHNRLEDIRLQHIKLTDTRVSESIDIDEMPIVVYQGCSIHGNEPSGANAALATVYYLAAAQGQEIEELLDKVVILFDPSYNPDGLNRFASWVNVHKGKHLISDPNSREYNEIWPRGRTNHYWFDLNRDWLLLTHPESQGRIRTFHHWKPDILTDHHEMGTNSTFFFQPGIESRTNTNTPKRNQELTYAIAKYHARALDKIGSLYYTKESFDDFYYGKGSTYPDAQGCIGILFEQASARGHVQATDNGLLTFPFAIRNQVTTMRSTQQAALGLRKEVLEYKRNSFLEARELAKKNPIKGYVFGEERDPYRVSRFIDILLQHQIEVYQLKKNFTYEDEQFKAGQSFVVPLDQDQYRLAKSIFEKVTSFRDSLFYDVSAWTVPLAFNIPYAKMNKQPNAYIGKRVASAPWPRGQLTGVSDPYVYLMSWHQYLAPKALNQMLEAGIILKLANEPFTVQTEDGLQTFDRGTVIIPVGNNQPIDKHTLDHIMQSIALDNHLVINSLSTGLVESGVNLGSRSLSTIKKPEAIMLVGNGVNSYDAGELWFHFDQIWHMAIPMIDISHLNRVNLSDYKTIIMPDGSYTDLKKHSGALKSWVQKGGNIVAIKGAINWLKNQEIIAITYKAEEKKETKSNPIESFASYADHNEERGSKVTGGMIAMADIDVTHPLFYGYNRPTLAIFKRGNSFYQVLNGKYNTPARYSQNAVLSGYLHRDNLAKMKGAAAVFTSQLGRGKVIGLVDNPVFRGYWWGSSTLLANALFLGHSY